MRARTPGSTGLLVQRLVALFVLGWALFDFPLLTLGLGRGPDTTLFGLPRLPVLLFAGWLGLIVALAWLMERGGTDRHERQDRQDRQDRPDAADPPLPAPPGLRGPEGG